MVGYRPIHAEETRVAGRQQQTQKTYLKTFNGTLPPRRAVLLYINTTWCGPCKRARPIMEEVARKSKLTVYSVDGDIHDKIGSWTLPRYYPTLYHYSNGHAERYPVASVSQAKPADILAWSTLMTFKH